MMAVELKSETGRPTAAQVDVLDSLRAAGMEVHLWRPSDWPTVQAVLTEHRSSTR